MLKYAAVFIALSVISSSCFFIRGKKIRGNGNVTTEERSVGDFNGVESFGSFDVFLTSGDNNSVKIEADENLMQYIETEISNDVLKIRTRNRINMRPSETIKVYLTANEYHKVKSAGSGNIYSRTQITSGSSMEVGIAGSGNIDIDIKAPEVSASIAGSGSIAVSGEADRIKSSIAGSGDIKAGSLKTHRASIHIAGSGNGHLNADEELDIRIAGSGDVRYSGNAKVSSSIAGSGSVTKISE